MSYEAVMSSGRNYDSNSTDEGKHPAYYVSWYDAIVYCNLRSIDDGLAPVYSLGGEKDPRKWQYVVKDETTGKCSGPATNCSAAVKTAWNNIAFDTSANGWRAPTEAEWEYLARGGSLTGTQYKYSGSDNIGDVAWHTGNANGKTHLVKSMPNVTTPKANGCGLYDMTGRRVASVSGTDLVLTLPIQGRCSGLYTLVIQQKGDLFTERVLIQ